MNSRWIQGRRMRAYGELTLGLAVAIDFGERSSEAESREARLPPRAAAADTAPTKESEASLCDRAMRGETAAWNALIERHNHRVVVSLLARGHRIDRAKDLAQDVWLRLIEQQRAGRLTHLSLPGLALTQAMFAAHESARRDGLARKYQSEANAERGPDWADPGADVEARLLSTEQLACARAVLARSSPSARRVFSLVYGGEVLSHAEVAARAGLSLQRVRQILCEVRKRIRAEIEGVHDE
jgi:RNA polymerase sigma factor (sigma-70 family)